MPLSAVMDNLDDVSEEIAALYTQKGDKFELTGISGVKTQSDVDRLHTAAAKERAQHEITREKYACWNDMDHEETMAKLDRIPELEAAAAGKLDEAALDDLATKRAEGIVKSRTSPLERQIDTLSRENEELKAQNQAFQQGEVRRKIFDAVRSELVNAKVVAEAHDDALMLAERVFEVTEDGAILTKDNVGFAPGASPELWLQEIQEKRPHWWPPSRGGGAAGSSGGGGGSNPWSKDSWNMTEQGQYLRQHGAERAAAMAKAAGTTLGGLPPSS